MQEEINLESSTTKNVRANVPRLRQGEPLTAHGPQHPLSLSKTFIFTLLKTNTNTIQHLQSRSSLTGVQSQLQHDALHQRSEVDTVSISPLLKFFKSNRT